MVERVENYHDLVRRDVFPLIPEQAGRVLDVGGGVGATSAALKAAGRASEAIVVDHVDQSAPGIDRTFRGNLEDATFLDGAIAEAGPFDTILCLDILEHLREPWKVVERLHAALKPGGVIVASIPNVNFLGLVGPLVFQGRYELQDEGILDRTHIRWFTRKTAVDMMTRTGLQLEAVTGTMGGRYKLMNTATVGLLRRFFVLQYLIRVRRPA